MAALVAGPGPVRDLVVRQPGAAEQRRRPARTCRPGRRRRGGGPGRSASGVPGLDRQAVGAHVRRLERERVVERAAPVVQRLADAAVDEVEVERRRSRSRRRASTARRTLAGSWVRPSAASTCGTIDCTPRLDAVHAGGAVGRQQRRRSRCRGCTRPSPRRPAPAAMASSTASSPSAGTSDGVPPPKNTLVATGMPAGVDRARHLGSTSATR